jgi:putative zinc finger protein
MNHVEAVKTLAIERYLLEEMTPEERDAFEEHFFSCMECGADARHAATMRDGVRGGLAGAATGLGAGAPARVLPLRPVSAGWRSSVALPWAAAALLAIGLGYQTVAGPSSSRRQAESYALTPSTLRPASRGQEAVVSPGPGAIVTLAVDLGGAQFDRDIRYELATADGKTIASGQAPLPSPGAPLLLMVPGSALTGSERFVLTLHNTGAANLTPATYRFRVRTP